MDWIRVTTVLLALAAPAAAAVETGQAQDRNRIAQALATPAAAGYARELAALGGQRDTHALAGALERIAADSALDDTARTALMHDALVALAATDPDPGLVPTLERHAAEPRTVLAWHEDEGHRAAIAIYDTGAAARYALHEWRRSDARREAAAALAHGTVSLAATTTDDAVHKGYADAFAAASPVELANARNELMHGLAAGWPVERPALVAATRLGDRELAAALLDRGRGRELVHALPELRTAFPAQDAFALLANASRRDDVGAAAVAQIGLLLDGAPAARAWLLETLADPRLGGGAAAALAADDAVIPALVLRLEGDHGAAAQARAALALHLNGSPPAHAALARAAADPRFPQHLKRSVDAWLR